MVELLVCILFNLSVFKNIQTLKPGHCSEIKIMKLRYINIFNRRQFKKEENQI